MLSRGVCMDSCLLSGILRLGQLLAGHLKTFIILHTAACHARVPGLAHRRRHTAALRRLDSFVGAALGFLVRTIGRSLVRYLVL